MSIPPPRPTRREQRRVQTVQEIKARAMDQIGAGGPDAVSLSGIVREMAMSPAAIYRYFANRDALLGDLVVDAYDDLADALVAIVRGEASAAEHLTSVLGGFRAWAVQGPNAYRLIFQTRLGSGQDLAVERTVPASSRSMASIVTALAAAGHPPRSGRPSTATTAPLTPELEAELAGWAQRTGLTAFSTEVLELALVAWTRLHGAISLELNGHLGATGIAPAALYDAEVADLVHRATQLAAE